VSQTLERRRGNRERGQSLPEFALVLIPFLLLLMGIFDLGRGIYTYNAAAQAAREIARSASVDLQNGASSVGSGSETIKVRNLQKKLVPGLTDSGIQISCVDIEDNPLTTACHSGDFVRVRITVTYRPVTPLLGLAGPIQLVSVSHLEVS
jgi:Flp pilus assembly protein TadG